MVQGVKIAVNNEGVSEIVDVNPATGEVIARVACSTRAQVDDAVAAAKSIQPSWAALELAERAELVRLAIRRIAESGSDALARLITQEMGKTLGEAQAEVADNADMDEYISLVKEANEPEVHGGSVIVRHAHGVVSICAPWNYPVEEIVLLSIPALIARRPSVIVLADIGILPDNAREALQGFVEDGGYLLRFAGPRLAAAPGDDTLVPVRLRTGERQLGGAMSWS